MPVIPGSSSDARSGEPALKKGPSVIAGVAEDGLVQLGAPTNPGAGVGAFAG